MIYSIYRKEKAAKKAPPPPKRKTPKQATTSISEQQTQSSDSNNSTESESEETKKTSAPSRKQKSSNAKNTKPTAEEKRAGSKPRKGVKLPHKAVNEDYEGSQEKGIPVVDSRPGKKRSRAGRPRKEARGGRKKMGEGKKDRAVDVTELVPPQHAHILPTTAQKRGMRAVEQDGVDDDPMLPEEELRPLIVNELAEDGTFVVNEMQEEVRLWDAEVSCRGGYHWVLGDVNSLNFADDPYPPTFIPEGDPGPNIPGIANMHAIHVLEKFLPLQFWSKFAQETNAYRDRCNQDPLNADPDEEDVEEYLKNKPHEKKAWQQDYDLKWVPMSLGSSLRWFGLHVGMAIRPHHNTASYWDRETYGCLRADDYSNYMSRNRFNLVTKYMYLNYAAGEHFDANGKLLDPYHKIRPLIDICKQTWRDNWFIGEFNAIDEGKVAYSGTMCPVRIYDPDKPIKHGIKFFCANDSLTGYCWGVEPYTGSGHRIVDEDAWDFDNLNFGARIVLYFCSKAPRYVSIFTDRFYTTLRCVELCYERHNAFLTGTMMTNKPGMPWQHLCGFDQLNSQRGYYTWAWEPKKNLWAIMWKDRNVVPLISNRYGVSPEFIERGGGGKYKTSKLKATNVPYGRYRFKTGKMVVPYNKYMGGTDLWDKMRMALFYSIEAVSHCHKWWQKCFWGLIDGALVNAFICWRSVDPKRRSHMRFMTAIHQALVNNDFDTTGTWGPKSLMSPDVSRRMARKSPGKYARSPKNPIVMIPKLQSPGE